MRLAIPVLALLGVAAEVPVARVEVNVTQKALVAACLDGKPIETTERKWRLPARPHTVSFTMGDDAAKAGFATVRFTPELGHRYEIEVRGPVTAFSTRVWERGTWQPVVRDRTVDRIVSGEPEWSGSTCSREAPAASTP
jgi:hypothetical protein